LALIGGYLETMLGLASPIVAIGEAFAESNCHRYTLVSDLFAGVSAAAGS
jgi:hypothetical protein